MNEMRRLLLPLFLAALVVAISPLTALAAVPRPGLASAGNFAVLAGSTVTNTGPSWITGLLGVAPGSAVTGFPPGTSGVQHTGDSVATTAQTDLAAAYTDTMGRPCPGTNNFTNVNLGGMILAPGVYCQTIAPTLTGTLTLNGSGVYIFQIGSTLVTAPSARVVLTGGAQPCDIFWQVGSSATIATSTTFVGNIMAHDSIAMQTGATLNGRALARTGGAVTLDTNRIIQPTGCGYAAPTAVAAPTPTPTPTPVPTASPTRVPGLPNTAGAPGATPDGLPWVPIALACLISGVLVSSTVWIRRRRA